MSDSEMVIYEDDEQTFYSFTLILLKKLIW